jgi:hypothetical protein
MNNKLLVTVLATAFSGMIFATEVTTAQDEVNVIIEANEIDTQEENLKKLAALTAAIQEVETAEEVAEATETQE